MFWSRVFVFLLKHSVNPQNPPAVNVGAGNLLEFWHCVDWHLKSYVSKRAVSVGSKSISLQTHKHPNMCCRSWSTARKETKAYKYLELPAYAQKINDLLGEK